MAGSINAGDTAWLLTSTLLVMLMTPGLALFYGGLVRGKNVVSTLMQSFFILALISVQWVLWGYTLAFGPDRGGLIGGLEWFALLGVGGEPNKDYAATIPHLAFMAFQMMFAIITPALITGAFAERKRFTAFALFSLLWATLVYDPIAHWVWGMGGWLRTLGAIDFAGGTVVHISSGVSALVAALVLGPRIKSPDNGALEGHNLTITALGAALLWFGWFGFNAGSALTSGALAATAFVATNSAAAMAGLTWMIIGWKHQGRPSLVGLCTGSVAGLVAVTPAAGYVNVAGALVIGMVAGALCYAAVHFTKQRLRVDDALDVFGVHGIGGLWGALATGIFATTAVNSAGANGLLAGNPMQLVYQAIAAVTTFAYAGGMTWLILKLLDLTIGIRVPEREEVLGLDFTQHGEMAYRLGLTSEMNGLESSIVTSASQR
ncbi:MAG TPA: ammonium transporter [bacterium]|nr:ammonium transporter [bacterium]